MNLALEAFALESPSPVRPQAQNPPPTPDRGLRDRTNTPPRRAHFAPRPKRKRAACRRSSPPFYHYSKTVHNQYIKSRVVLGLGGGLDSWSFASAAAGGTARRPSFRPARAAPRLDVDVPAPQARGSAEGQRNSRAPGPRAAPAAAVHRPESARPGSAPQRQVPLIHRAAPIEPTQGSRARHLKRSTTSSRSN